MKDAAQIFMSTHRVAICYECDGFLFKREENAKARERLTGKPVIAHELNAGPVTKKDKQE